MTTTARITPEQYASIAALPEYANQTLELIDGEIVSTMPSNGWSSLIAILIARLLADYVLRKRLGYVTGEQGGYRLGEHVLVPDVAYISRARLARIPREGFIPLPPDLAFEVTSPTDTLGAVAAKVALYRAHGVTVCVVHPLTETVEVYAPGEVVRLFTRSDVLSLPALLPGFAVPLNEIFPQDDDAQHAAE
jgi:Uma2 family endonuclease